VERGALRAALADKLASGALVVVDELSAAEIKTKSAVELLKRLGIAGKAVLVDVAVDEKLSRSVRNIPGVSLVASARLTARDVADASRVVATPRAVERLQEALGGPPPEGEHYDGGVHEDH
jgi:large subunit ribosomal protein L4